MTRIAAILAILLLFLIPVIANLGGDRGKPIQTGANRAIGEGYGYSDATLARFDRLLEGGAWSLADPPRNSQGMLEAVHVRSRLAFVVIPAGEYLMGSPNSEVGRETDEIQHLVTVGRSFLLCRTECTQQSWQECGGENKSATRDSNLPLESATWIECRRWCNRLGFRLPTEEEWEYACRAGTQTRFSFGDTDLNLPEFGWYFINSGNRVLPAGTEWGPDKIRDEQGCKTHAVALKAPNPWGLYDMHGNVWEWCEDWYRPYPGGGFPLNELHARSRIIRGGGLAEPASSCRSARRGCHPPELRLSVIGFRPVADLPR